MAQITLNSSGVASNGSLLLQSNGTTTAVTIDASQNVGIGTVSPSAKLDVQNNGDIVVRSYSTNASNQAFVQAVSSAGTFIGLLQYGGSKAAYGALGSGKGALYSTDNVTIMADTASGIINFATGGNTERARITSGGDLLVGTTSSTVYGVNFKNRIVSAGDYAQQIQGTGSDSIQWIHATNTSGDNKFVSFVTDASSVRGSIDYNRAAGLVRYNTISDATLKNIIGDSDGVKSIEILNSTRIRDYSWKDDTTNKTQIGVIAQELYETFKGAVSVGGDKVAVDEEGNETTKYVPWAVDKTAFTFHLIAGWQKHEQIIQEQQAIIQTLTDRITALEQA